MSFFSNDEIIKESGIGAGDEVLAESISTEVDENSFAPVLPNGDFLLENKSGTTPDRERYYDETFVLGKRWDEPQPIRSKEGNKRSYPDVKSYDTDGKRQVNSMYFSDVLGIPQEDAYIQHDQLGKELFDVDDTPDGYFKRIKGRWNAGKASVARSEAASKILIDILRGKEFDSEAVKRAQQAGPKTTQDEMQKLRAWHEKMIGETVEQLPFTIEAGKFGIGGALVGAGVGFLLKSPKIGAKVGAIIGAGGRTAQLEAGGAFLEMLEVEDENGNKIDPQIAAAVSLGVGAINGGLEVGELSVILGTFGIGTSLFEGAARKVSTKLLANGTLRQIALKHSLKFGVALTTETAQEIVQEAAVIIGTEIAKEITNQRKGTGFEVAFDQEGFASAVAGRLIETGKKSLLGFPLLLGPGTLVSAVKEGAVATLKATKEEIEARQEVKETEDEVLADITEEIQVDDVIESLSQDKKIQDKAAEIKALPDEKKVDAIINQPAATDEQGVIEEELTIEDKAAIKKLEAEVEAEEAEVLEPNIHIGNLTQRMKKVLAEQFGKKPEDIGPFLEGAFLTKRTKIKITRAQAREFHDTELESLLDRLDNNKINTENQLAQANADWGNIKELRKVLGLLKIGRPFRVQRAGKNIIVTIESAKERIRSAIQPGVLEDANLTIGQVLNITLKRVAQAARHAFSVGKKEGVAQTKEHFRQVKERLAARKKLKVRIDKALKRINKKISGGVDFFYAEAITTLQKEIDPKKRIRKTLERRQRQREFLGKSSPEEIKSFPQKLFDSLNAKPLNDVTVAELEELADKMDSLKKLGKTKFNAKERTRKAVQQKNIKKSIFDMNKGKPFPEQPTTGAERNSEGLIKKLNSLFLLTLRMPRILDWIDGGKGTFKGKMHDLFYNRVNDQTNKELVEIDRRSKSMRDNMDSLGITDDELTREIPVGGGVNMFIEEVMGVYAALKNPKAKEAMLAQLRISEKTALGVVTNLNPKFIKLADAVIADYADSYARLRAAHIEFTNEDLGAELFYTPMVRLEKDGQLQNTDIVDQILARQGLRRTQTAKGFTIDRESIAPENQKPLDLKLMSVWRSQSAKQEHYTHFASLIKDLNGYLADDSFKKVINAKLGKGTHKILKDYVARVASPDAYKGFGTMEVLSRRLRGNIAMAYLSYNLLTVLKQAPSMALYLKDAGAANIMSSIGEFVANPKALLEKVRSKDPQVQHNLIAREFQQLANANDPTYRKLIKKVGQAGLEGIKFVDAVVRSIGWNAVYTKELQLNGSEMEARREAQNSTLRTQPTAGAKDIAALYTQNEVFNWFLMFTQQLNQIWNITTYDTFANWNNKNYQAAATDMLAVSLSAMFIWMISNKRLPEDEDDFLDMASDQFINMVPLIGKDIMGGKKGWGGAEIAPFEAVKGISKAVFSGDMEEIALETIKQSAAASGVPVVAIKRVGRFLESGELVELIGGKR